MTIKYLFQTWRKQSRKQSKKRSKIYYSSYIILLLCIAVLFAGCGKQQDQTETEKALILEDGEYTPDAFTWSGGSGRVQITCDELSIENGQAYATICFSSPYYTSVKMADTSYEGIVSEETSTFKIPVCLNESNVILGITTKMTTAHEIEYSIFPSLYLAGESKTVATEKIEIAAQNNDVNYSNSLSRKPPEIEGLKYQGKMELEYASGFDVFYYQDDYTLIQVYGSEQYLLIPEGAAIPEGVDEKITILQNPLDHIYLAATSAMALFRAVDAIDRIQFTGTKASGWYVKEASEALQNGKMLFAGKYSEPDYELLIQNNCDLAIESTMILHDPKVIEMLENMGIPVFIDRSSYEEHPFGRMEWIKLYGVLTGCEKKAVEFFQKQTDILNQLENISDTGKDVAFFYIDTSGRAVVRNTNDYITKMIELAGGEYILKNGEIDLGESTSQTLSMEEFYVVAKDADYLIYNGTIDNPLESLEMLSVKSELFQDFKAVQENQVWTIDKNLYQATDMLGEFILDIYKMLDGNEQEMTFLKKVE